MTTQIPAGWYPQPEQPNIHRWWDGAHWTEHLQYGPTPSDARHPHPAPVLATVAVSTTVAVQPTPAGWYQNAHGTQWWNGSSWDTKGPRNRQRLSLAAIPIYISAPFIAIIAVISAIQHPLVIPIIIPTAALLFAALWWLDRLEPEPRKAKLFALAWGATVAPLIALAFGAPLSLLNSDMVSAAIGAPLLEEAGKALVLVVLLKKRFIDSPIDGVVYAIYAAVGFALLEDILYYAAAADEGGTEGLLTIAIVRGVVTPFAHPLFTTMIGLAVGWVAKTRPKTSTAVLVIAAGYLTATALHGVWNGTLLTVGDGASYELILGIGMFFFCSFIGTVVALIVIRQREAAEFLMAIRQIGPQVGITAPELAVLSDTKTSLSYRRTLTKPKRKLFNELRSTLHSMAATQSAPKRTVHQQQDDAQYLDELRQRAETVRSQLLAP